MFVYCSTVQLSTYSDWQIIDRRGNRILIILSVINIAILYPGTKAYYVWRNKQRAKIWDAMTPEVIADDFMPLRPLLIFLLIPRNEVTI